MIKALKKMFGVPEVPKIPEMKFPKDYPEFDEMFDKISKLVNEFVKANPYTYYEAGDIKVYMGLDQYKIYSDWFYGFACFHNYRPEDKDLVCG